ncbi:bifunctional DNA primase/polymerase [Saccharothrix obliqua]|uniref:bifunctional DNA primase/polymerase n=1 Tax=Saccharothrix obliqua TaxID=2861747 RepID=UPI001C5D3981|nr:bifunctional DNA primase/polymerase [Saccharothrix obliqua]MBW4720720.1 bifunctional DNA primase/polymerase [Saccharothrix obliqua]
MPIAEQTVLEAALTYAGMGWKLLPGTVCRDGALINPLTGEKTDEITVHARGEATTDPDRVRQWWDVPDDMRPDILGAADESIGFVLVRDYLAETITASPWFTAKPTPVVGQKGLPMMAVFIVRPPFPQARSDIRPFPHGALIRLPPSPNVSWLVSPWQTNLTFLTATEFAELVTLTEITAP